MILRKAKLEDFPVFKEMYVNAFQWLYEDKTNIYNEENISILNEDIEMIDEEINQYSIKDFTSDIKNNYIILIEDEIGIIGYIYLFYTGFEGKYKIAEIAFAQNMRESDIKDILRKLIRLNFPKLKSYFICTSFENVQKFLVNVGFKKTSSTFYELEIAEKKG